MKIVIIMIINLFLVISCDFSENSNFSNKLVLYAYAEADSTLDSLYLSRYAGMNEKVNFPNLAISDAKVYLYEENIKIDSLLENQRKGVYSQEQNSKHTFIPNKEYSLVVIKEGYDTLFASTICPEALQDIMVKDFQSEEILSSIEEAPLKIDTLSYKIGNSFLDNKMLNIVFDSQPLLLSNQLISFTIIPDNYGKESWLEDTTSSVWDDYDLSVLVFKSKKRYGKNYTDYRQYSIDINWTNLYHKGENTLILATTDNSLYKFILSQNENSKDERWSNVENGFGLFTISNASGIKNKYRIFIK